VVICNLEEWTNQANPEENNRSRKAENAHVVTELVFNLPFTFIITLQQLFLKKVNKFDYKTF